MGRLVDTGSNGRSANYDARRGQRRSERRNAPYWSSAAAGRLLTALDVMVARGDASRGHALIKLLKPEETLDALWELAGWSTDGGAGSHDGDFVTPQDGRDAGRRRRAHRCGSASGESLSRRAEEGSRPPRGGGRAQGSVPAAGTRLDVPPLAFDARQWRSTEEHGTKRADQRRAGAMGLRVAHNGRRALL